MTRTSQSQLTVLVLQASAEQTAYTIQPTLSFLMTLPAAPANLQAFQAGHLGCWLEANVRSICSPWTSARRPLPFWGMCCSAPVLRHATCTIHTSCQRCWGAAAQADVASAVARAAGALDQPSAVLTSVAASGGSSYSITVLFPPAERVRCSCDLPLPVLLLLCMVLGVWWRALLGLACGHEHRVLC